MKTVKIDVTTKQVELLKQYEQAVRAAMEQASAVLQGILSGCDNVPEESVLKGFSTDPPQVILEYEAKK